MSDKRILLINSYYPDGLTDEMVQRHYKKYQKDILPEIYQKNVALLIYPETNNFIWLRHIKKRPIVINSRKDFTKIIHNRVLGIFIEVSQSEKMFVVDVDGTNLDNNKIAIIYLYQLFSRQNWLKNVEVVYTGKKSFHLHLIFPYKVSLDRARMLIEKTVWDEKHLDLYMTTNKKVEKNIVPNVDFATLRKRALYICPGSLSQIGLRSQKIDIEALSKVQPLHFKVW